MKGMILAAGYGTRFRPTTLEVPKPMVPVCNRPLIAWAADALLSAGVSDIVVNLHHLPQQIEDFLRAHYGQRCRFHFSHEPAILGTGGGVRNAREFLHKEEMFLLVNGDTIHQPPFEVLARTLRTSGAVATLLLRHAPPNDRFTPVMAEGGWVTGFGKGKGEELMFAGAHAVSRRLFDFLPDRPVSGLVEDVYGPLVERGKHVAGVVDDGMWFDIGTPLRYLTASLEILQFMKARRLAPPEGSRMEAGSLFGAESRGAADASVVGARCSIAGEATVRQSVLWDDVVVDSRSTVDSSVLTRGVEIPPGSRIENALLCRRLEGTSYDNNFLLTAGLVAAPINDQRPLLVDLRGS